MKFFAGFILLHYGLNDKQFQCSIHNLSFKYKNMSIKLVDSNFQL